MTQTMLWCCAECMASALASGSCMSTCASSERSSRYSSIRTCLTASVRARNKGLHAMSLPYHSRSLAGILLQSNSNITSSFDNSIDSSVTLNINVNKDYIKTMTLNAIKELILPHSSCIACINQASNKIVYQVLTRCR